MSRSMQLALRTLCAAIAATLVCTFAVTATAQDAKPNGQKSAAEKEDKNKDADEKATRTLGVVLYPGFELLDVYGPVEMFGNLGKQLKVVMVAAEAGEVASTQGPKVVADYGFEDCLLRPP